MRSRAFPVSLQVMALVLRLFATGSFQAVVCDVHNISRPSVIKIVRDVTQCLLGVANVNITLPLSSHDLAKIINNFSLIVNIRMSGKHVRIISPSVDEHIYVNRKNYHSINVQGVCDVNLNSLTL